MTLPPAPQLSRASSAALLALADADAYSLLTHEQLIDLTWDDSIVPLLLSRYPGLTPAQLEEASAYAYGGCVIQDIGYYPFGDLTFSNLTHYVRTGDFVVSLFRNAENATSSPLQLARSRTTSATPVGHSQATNRRRPGLVPKAPRQIRPGCELRAGKAPACANRVRLRHR